MPRIKLRNQVFQNNGDLTFNNINPMITGDMESFSNGVIYADLDNDGDLDVVVNNIEDTHFVYQNLTIDKALNSNDYLSLQLEGSPLNRNGIGATLLIYKGSEQLVFEHYPVRGYQSSIHGSLIAGVGEMEEVDSMILIWPDSRFEYLDKNIFNKKTLVKWSEELPLYNFSRLSSASRTEDFKDITEEIGLDYRHEENDFVEFLRETLIPNMVSTEGPAIVVGDVNNDGLEDVFIGSSKRIPSELFIQTPGGKFLKDTPETILNDSTYEDVDASLADLDNDGDLDLIVASGGNEFWGQSEWLTQRYYLNDGDGKFSTKYILPDVYMTASCVLVSDFDGDGLKDLFFGGRAVPKYYGEIPESYLFRNLGNGRFQEVTDKFSNELKKIGLVKDGKWTDIDQDGDDDLLLATEWNSIQLFLNQGDSFERTAIGEEKGWWNFVYPYDFDRDGDMDIIAGNSGLNSKLKPTPEEPVRLYVNDLDQNGSLDQILTYYIQGKEVPFATYQELTTQIVSLKKKYIYSKDLAKASLEEIFGEKFTKSEVLSVNTSQSLLYENKGNLDFEPLPLPDELQLAPIETAIVLDNDNKLLVGGNFYECNIEMGRYDASYGHILEFGNGLNMNARSINGLNINGQVRRIVPIKIDKEMCYILARNNDEIVVLKTN
jgi:hypothetical protein